jgi:flavin prenyltransferase
MIRTGSPTYDDLVVAVTGASGAVYAVRLLQMLRRMGRTVHLTMSPSAVQVFREELGLDLNPDAFDPAALGGDGPGSLVYHHHQDFGAGIASGSFPTGGMVIIPCSMSTLGSIAAGITNNLVTRAADVHLKERRKLVLVPRETPLSLIHLENMLTVTRAGAVVLPAMPGWYHRPRRLEDLVDFVVGRVCDQFGIPNALSPRWGDLDTRDPLDETRVDTNTELDETHPELFEEM